MKIRKRIAVIMCDISHPYQQRILKGIIKQAHALDYDVAVFTKFMNVDDESDYQYGENHIFTLINYDLFDAVIYAPGSVSKRALRDFFAQNLKEHCRCPVVLLESDQLDYPTVVVDDSSAFERVVTHLIEDHHLEDILCLTGFEGNLQAEARLQGYRNAMVRHGFPIREDRIIYGDFWKEAALKLAQNLADGKVSMPQAVVCVSDFVAITLCNRLIELGIQIPEDLIVLGFDATQDAADNVPSVTTYVRPLAGMGMKAVLLLHRILTGEELQAVEEDHGYLVPAESCGCEEDFEQKFSKHRKKVSNVINYQGLFNACPMAESLNAAPTLNKCLGKIINFTYLIRDMKDFHLCLCDQWDDFERTAANGDDYKHYTDTMRLRISITDYDAAIVDEPFQKSELLPALFEKPGEPRVLYFTPLHFNERCFGYCAMGYGNNPQAFDDIYHSWIRNINNALEFVRVRNIFNSMHQRLYMASIRDTLTGVFNRKGFKRYSAEFFQRAATSEKKLLVIAADLDCLKIINDNYGHLEGDNAICIVANALNTCFENDEICARTGGDEFVAIGCANYTDEQIGRYLDYIQQFLARYNDGSDKPYTVGASVGYVCQTVTEADDLQTILDEADAKMYKNKILRKKNRQ